MAASSGVGIKFGGDLAPTIVRAGDDNRLLGRDIRERGKALGLGNRSDQSHPGALSLDDAVGGQGGGKGDKLHLGK